MKDKDYMAYAIKLAEKARGNTSPNPLVGAVLVKNGEIVGEGFHKKAGSPHAEIIAIENAGEKAKDSTLYVTLEPCNHHGRTPPCTLKIIESGIKRVVIGMLDPNPHVKGGGAEFLKQHGISVEHGILENECKKQNEIFLRYITKGRPFVIMKVAMTIDGKICTKTGDAKWITSNRARKYVHKLRSELDAIMIGRGTAAKDNPSLTVRLVEGKDPIRIVLDSHLSLPSSLKLFHQDSDALTYLITLNKSKNKRVNVDPEKVKIIYIDEKDGKINIKSLLKRLGEMEITSILLEGGAELNATFLKEGLIDKFLFFIAPKIIGGNGKGPVGGDGVKFIKDAFLLSDMEYKKIGQDLLITAYPQEEK